MRSRGASRGGVAQLLFIVHIIRKRCKTGAAPHAAPKLASGELTIQSEFPSLRTPRHSHWGAGGTIELLTIIFIIRKVRGSSRALPAADKVTSEG